ncbi:hypothetical protein [Bdellovibrio bacteriovorus]|uniref:Uncharacterized protein n=1 Tax=Bdellovibrio bacteriovorus TaxID=959 RepID=A0A150WBS9_BDEBC|nr:hypothetical protein [Bdellovibrio bacteriovorus]KYG60332.1 hypothetical protein AZI85_12720 [Bdellovibrio bacteriovorus]
MKALVLFVALFGSTAMAELKPVGTFVPSVCGYNEIQTFCFGRRVGFTTAYASLSSAHGTEVYEIVQRAKINGGINPLYTAEQLTLENEEGRISAVVRGQKNRPYSSSATVTYEDGTIAVFTDFGAVFTTL